VKREKPEPLLDDVALCVQMGWTWEQMQRQPVRFVERLQIYLGAVADKQGREQRRLEEEIERLRRMGR
jgi:translation elongation factor EF-1beta